MRRLVSLLFCGFFFITLAAQEPFTGSFVMDIRSYTAGEDKPTHSKMKYHIGDNKVALEFLEQSGVQKSQLSQMRMVMHPKEKKVYTLINQGGSKMAFEMEVSEETLDPASSNEDIEVNVTGKTKQLRGYQCKEVIIIDDQIKTTAWVAENKEFNNSRLFFFQNANPMRKNKTRKKAKTEGFPVDGWTLQAVGYDKQSGQKVYRYDITKIKEGTVDEKLFDVSDYQIMDASQFQR